ncbi:ankyrin repeat-containing domain protein [Chytriomyces sp. MP71]|nr:ankyrin repeat-containing domain protein [Chytriomyces sp. MP71]
MLPAIKLARRHKRLDITSENAMLVAIVASVYADVPLLQETIAIEGFNESKIADLFAWGAAANCMQSVEFFLSWGYSPPAAALIHAAANGHFETVKRLLENAEAWFYASTLSVALIAACEKGSVNVDVVRCLLSVSLTNPGHNKNAALIASVEGGHTELVSLLLETKKCDPSDQDNKCVLLATSKGYEDIIDLLLNTESCKLNISVNDNAPIRVAVSGGYTRMVASLLATRNCDPSAIDNQCIITACTNGFTHIVELLLRHPSVDPRASQCDSLVRAAKGGYFEIVEMLLEWHGPEGEYMDPSAQNNATIVEASKNGHASVVRVLLDCEGVSARVNNNEAFYRACCGGHLEVAELLYFSRDLKLDPAVGLRACEEAAKGAHTSTVSFLLRVVGVPVSSSVLLLVVRPCRRK